MNDLNSLTGGPRAWLVIDGERYGVHELTLGELGELQSWVNSQYADPLAYVTEHIGTGLTPAQEQHLLRSAIELATKPRALLGTPEADALVRGTEGSKVMLWLAIRKGRPGFTLDQARAVLDRLTPAQLQQAFEASSVEAVLGAPKATEGGTP